MVPVLFQDLHTPVVVYLLPLGLWGQFLPRCLSLHLA